jgi:hypothetical protein
MLSSSDLTLTIYPENQASFGPCECCGNMTSRVWGYINNQDEGVAAYYVEWTPGHQGQQANFDFIVGRWGEGAGPGNRKAISLEFRKLETGPAFMVINASDRKVAESSLVSGALDRNDVIGTPMASTVFAMCNLIYLQDERISELRDA